MFLPSPNVNKSGATISFAVLYVRIELKRHYMKLVKIYSCIITDCSGSTVVKTWRRNWPKLFIIHIWLEATFNMALTRRVQVHQAIYCNIALPWKYSRACRYSGMKYRSNALIIRFKFRACSGKIMDHQHSRDAWLPLHSEVMGIQCCESTKGLLRLTTFKLIENVRGIGNAM